MTTDMPDREERLRELAHNVGNCLHVIGMGVRLLREVRGDDRQFGEVSESIDRAQKEALQLVHEFLEAAQ